MKTGVYPMKVKLKLFFDWGIKFEGKYEVPEQADREVAYAYKEEIAEGIRKKYHKEDYDEPEITDTDFASASGGVAQEQREAHKPHTEHEQETDDDEAPEKRTTSVLKITGKKSPQSISEIQNRQRENERYEAYARRQKSKAHSSDLRVGDSK